MSKRYEFTFQFCDTEEEAKELCEYISKHSNAYCRKCHPARYTPWVSKDGKENKFVVAWYW